MAECGFVDDTDTMHIRLQEEDYITVAANLQDTLKWWEVFTHVSGGINVPNKNWYELVSFEWGDCEWSYGKNLGDAQLTVQNMMENTAQLKILEPNEVKKMLFFYT